MPAHAATFWEPKRGSSPQEYEDAFWVGPDGHSNGEVQLKSFRVAIADGASSSLLAGRWARRLVAIFGVASDVTRTKASFTAAYREAAQGWDEEVFNYTAGREQRGIPIQWYEEPGLAKGAHSTLLVVDFNEGRAGHKSMWKAAGIGDSCLFQVRNDSLYSSFPMKNATEFSYQPPLLPSRRVEDKVVRNHAWLKTSDWEPEDSFYLATDALAEWFLRGCGAGGRPWEPLRDLDTDAELDFATWVDQQRDIGGMHDDDTTLVRIDIW